MGQENGVEIINKEHNVNVMWPFKVGDLVRLKSGGPVMTVDQLDIESGLVGCMWFCTDGTPDQWSTPPMAVAFRPGSLEAVITATKAKFAQPEIKPKRKLPKVRN